MVELNLEEFATLSEKATLFERKEAQSSEPVTCWLWLQNCRSEEKACLLRNYGRFYVFFSLKGKSIVRWRHKARALEKSREPAAKGENLMKKVIGLLLVLALVFTLAGPVAAMNGNGVNYDETNNELTIENLTASWSANNPITVAGD